MSSSARFPTSLLHIWLLTAWLLSCVVLNAQEPQVRERPAAPEDVESPTWSDRHYVAWLEKRSMLHEATALAAQLRGADFPWQHRYALPQPREAVKAAPVWLLNYPGSVITRPGESVIGAWAEPELWKALTEIGINVLHTGPVRTAGGLEGYRHTPTVDGWFDRISLGVDPQLGSDDEYRRMVRVARKYGGFVAGDIIPLHTGKGADFRLAERAYENYPGMYVMVEIPERDWELLPPVRGLWESRPLSREAARQLTRKGYLPGLIHSNDAVANALDLSGWDVTAEILGVDGRTRRWAYLHFFKPGQPTLNWLDPSTTAQRVIAGDVVKTIHDLGAKIIRLDAVPFLGIEPCKDSTMTWHYQHPLSVWGTDYLAFLTRKLGGWTFQELNVPLEQLKPFAQNGSDLSYDFFTRTQVLHSLLIGDAVYLRQAYGFLKHAGVQPVTLVHDLQNHDEITYQLVELDHRGHERFTLNGRTRTGREIREEMLETMRREAAGPRAPYNLLYRPQRDGLATTFAGFIAAALKIPDPYQATAAQVHEIQRAHLLLAAANAMQPGAFSLSSWDLVGALPLRKDVIERYLEDQDYRWGNRGGVDLLGVNPAAQKSSWGLPRAKSLYGSLPEQLQRPDSFASQLKRILAARKRSGIALGELVAVPDVKNSAFCVLVYRLEKNRFAVTALNFSRRAGEEEIRLSAVLPPHGNASVKLLDVLSNTQDATLTADGRLQLSMPPLATKTLLLDQDDSRANTSPTR